MKELVLATTPEGIERYLGPPVPRRTGINDLRKSEKMAIGSSLKQQT
jgi:hypothetical protein